MSDPILQERRRSIARRHQQIGWLGLLVFLCLGIALESLHGFKIGWYLDPASRLRRLLWTLAHAHGTLLALVHIAFSISLLHFGRWKGRSLQLASFFLTDALIFLPLGFLLGGIGHTEVDPSPGIFLVPLGAAFLLASIAMIAVASLGQENANDAHPDPSSPAER